MLPLPVALLTLVLCACSVGAQDLIFFEFVVEDLFEGQSNNITLRRFGIVQGDIQIDYTITGLGLSSPDDFTGGNFSIVYPPTEDPLKVPIDVKDNSVCDNGRAIFVRITGIDKAPIPETDLRLFIVVDDDGEWTAWDTSEGPCNCDTDMRDRVRNRTCTDKGIAGRTCDGPSSINDTVSCAGDPACTTTPAPTTTTTMMPTTSTTMMPTTTPWAAWSALSGCYGPWNCWEPGECSVTCGEGLTTEMRTRELLDCGNNACDGPLEERRTAVCNEQSCVCAEALTNWSQWLYAGSCSATCDGVVPQMRNRTCIKVSGCPGVMLNQTRTASCSKSCDGPWG
ncbi:A disintegrin and metalloproteinase with thrombospondin motifs adt-2-like isoform X1 [Haliotis rufescens]|uniref:A disintegrin and metalloproteinase with thrombospondin motifs adt-2-like isoform X1 n=1 Tax=Haliotis rufescens TaxID=6454 RepID=UPI001EAF8FFB|nr:A disintegrin and metalloproteinase with thrombospondin motifs adt-2-like isoform X1 [Haliotis rufescens]